MLFYHIHVCVEVQSFERAEQSYYLTRLSVANAHSVMTIKLEQKYAKCKAKTRGIV